MITRPLPNLDPSIAELLKRMKERLEKRFGSRLKNVIVYGSRTRGDEESDSDLDVMVLLEPPVDGFDSYEAIKAVYPLQLEVDFPIHATTIDAELFARGEYAIYRNVQREGIVV